MSQQFWVFPVDPSLATSIRHIAVSLHDLNPKSRELPRLRKQLIHALNDAIDSGFVFYYERPAEYSSLNPVVKRAIRSIIDTIRLAIHKVVQHVFKSLSHSDLQQMANYLDSMILPAETSGSNALLAYPLGEALSVRLENTMDSIRCANRVSDYDRELYGVFVDIVENSVRYYYQKPTALIRLNPVAKKIADVGIDTTVKGVKRILKHVIKEVKHEEVAVLPDNLHFLVIEREPKYTICTPDYIPEK